MTQFQVEAAALFAAELQFRLASAVRLASTIGTQPLDVPLDWTHGKHHVRYGDVALRSDQGDFASWTLHRSATYMLAMVAKDAIRTAVPDPKAASDPKVQAAYQISRLTRNAFAHAPFNPIWSIDRDCQNRVFELKGIIRLDTTGLNGQPFDWRHYGGPLALLALAWFVRQKILGVKPKKRVVVPLPKNVYIEQGDLILKRARLPDENE